MIYEEYSIEEIIPWDLFQPDQTRSDYEDIPSFIH